MLTALFLCGVPVVLIPVLALSNLFRNPNWQRLDRIYDIAWQVSLMLLVLIGVANLIRAINQ